VRATGRFPLPEVVCGYGTRPEFEAQRLEAGQWVYWPDRVDCILAGQYEKVKPLHVELSPTYLCNFSCPWCSCRTARETWVEDDVFSHPKANAETVMAHDRLDVVLTHLAEHKIGIQWVGGEPTIYPMLYRAAKRAQELQLTQCVFTNGASLGPKRIRALYEAELAFVRVSLNAVTKAIHELHHDYRPERNYADRVLGNVRELVKIKHELGAKTKLGISVVADERNLSDIVPTARFIVGLCEEFGQGAVDFAIFRPTYQFYDAQLDLAEGTVSRLGELIAAGSEARTMLEAAGVRPVVPSDSFRPESETPDATLGNECLAAGMFGEITPRGDAVLCSDRYGNPDYFIGSAVDSTFDELWGGDRRRRVLDHARHINCFKTECPRNGRGYFFNKLFHTIEVFRRNGEIARVEAWIEDLRDALPVPEHSFFI